MWQHSTVVYTTRYDSNLSAPDDGREWAVDDATRYPGEGVDRCTTTVVVEVEQCELTYSVLQLFVKSRSLEVRGPVDLSVQSL